MNGQNKSGFASSEVKLSETQAVNITVQKLMEPEELQEMIIVIFSDVIIPVSDKKHKETNKGTIQDHRVSEITKEFRQAREEVQSLREDMQTSQEELRAANEELQSMNEELQSTNEELTTSKEELQSMNEEMQMVNQELQSKVEELSHTKDDMENLLNSIDIATLFLDKDLKVKSFTPQTTSIIKLIPSDINRPFTDLASKLDYPDIAKDAREVLRSLIFRELAVSTFDGRWFNIRIMPYRTQDNHIDGVVITFVNSTKTKMLEISLYKTLSLLQSRFNKQEVELGDAKKLETILKKAQALLEEQLIDQDVNLKKIECELQKEKGERRET